MCDQLVVPGIEPFGLFSFKQLLNKIAQKWQEKDIAFTRRTLSVSTIILISILLLISLKEIIMNWIVHLVQKFYIADSQSLIGQVFQSVAQLASRLPVESYINKAQLLFLQITNLYFVFVVIFIIWIFRSILPWSFHLPNKSELISFIKSYFYSFSKAPIIFAGIILGLTTSIRILGPLAGLIIALYIFLKGGKRIFPYYLLMQRSQ